MVLNGVAMIDKGLQIAWNGAVGLFFLGILATMMAAKALNEKR